MRFSKVGGCRSVEDLGLSKDSIAYGNLTGSLCPLLVADKTFSVQNKYKLDISIACIVPIQ